VIFFEIFAEEAAGGLEAVGWESKGDGIDDKNSY